MSANDPLAKNSYNNSFIGCSISNYLAQNGNIAGFLIDSVNDIIVNSYFKITVSAVDSYNIGGIAGHINNLLLINSTAIISISQLISNRTNVGGVAAMADGNYTIKNSDFLTYIILNESDGHVGGLIG